MSHNTLKIKIVHGDIAPRAEAREIVRRAERAALARATEQETEG